MAPHEAIPEDANEHCPGPAAEGAGTADACAGCPNQSECASAPKAPAGPDPDALAIARRLAGVKHVVLVLSGKGGVGKSTCSAQLAFALASRGFEVGLMDVDICGPSLPRMLGLEGEEIHQSASGWSPVYVHEGLGVMSIGFMLPDPDDAVIWRGPRKNGLIKQFLRDVDWGELDFLLIDSPPGTSDEHISVVQLLKAAGNLDGAVIVTTPQEVACADVRKEASFCRKTGVKVLGVVENMAGLVARVEELTIVAAVGRGNEQGVETAGRGQGGDEARGRADADEGANAGAGGASDEAAPLPDDEASSSSQRAPPEDVTFRVFEALRAAGLDPSSLLATLDVFPAAPGGGARAIARASGAPLLGSLPLDARLGAASERGVSVLEDPEAAGAPCAGPLRTIVDGLLAAVGERPARGPAPDDEGRRDGARRGESAAHARGAAGGAASGDVATIGGAVTPALVAA